MSSIQTFDEFTKARTAPPRTIQLSREVGAKFRGSFGLSADAPIEEVAEKLDDLGKAAKDQEAEHKLVPVQRGKNALDALPAPPRRAARSMPRAARGKRARLW